MRWMSLSLVIRKLNGKLIADCIIKHSWVMIFSTGEPPQYIGVPTTGGKTGDIVRISQ